MSAPKTSSIEEMKKQFKANQQAQFDAFVKKE